jgi:hypothetical protein
VFTPKGTIDGGTFRFSAGHFEWIAQFAQTLGLEWGEIGKRRHGREATLRFCDALTLLYGSEDESTSAGASYAVEHWAAAGFWRELIAGVQVIKRTRLPELPLGFGTGTIPWSSNMQRTLRTNYVTPSGRRVSLPNVSCALVQGCLMRWPEQPWRCLTCGAPIDPYLADTEQSIFKTYRRVVAGLAHSVELKRLCADGTEPMPGKMRGLTIPLPVHVTSIEHIGKEVIVDPTDTPEGMTAEQLNATDSLVYRDASKMYEKLRAKIRTISISSVARAAKVSRSVKPSSIQRTAPHRSTIAKIEAAVEPPHQIAEPEQCARRRS